MSKIISDEIIENLASTLPDDSMPVENAKTAPFIGPITKDSALPETVETLADCYRLIGVIRACLESKLSKHENQMLRDLQILVSLAGMIDSLTPRGKTEAKRVTRKAKRTIELWRLAEVNPVISVRQWARLSPGKRAKLIAYMDEMERSDE